MLTEVREIIRSEDRAQFDELIYKPAGLIGLNKNDPNINVPFQQGGGGDPNNQVGTNKALVNSNNPSGIPGIMDNFADNVHNVCIFDICWLFISRLFGFTVVVLFLGR